MRPRLTARLASLDIEINGPKMHLHGRLSPIRSRVLHHHGNHRLACSIQRGAQGCTMHRPAPISLGELGPPWSPPSYGETCSVWSVDTNAPEPPADGITERIIDASGSQTTVPDPAFRTTLSYIDRSRRYYRASGYETAYRWATHIGDDTPFAPLSGPLNQARVAVATTAFPNIEGERPAKQVYAAAVDPVPTEMFTRDLFWHKEATHTDDVGSFLPLKAAAAAVENGRVASLNHRFYGIPTTYSQRATADNGREIEKWCRQDGVDLVLLVPL